MRGTKKGRGTVNRISYCNTKQSFSEYKKLHCSFVEHCCKTYKEGVFAVDEDGTPVFYTKSIKISEKSFLKRS